MRMVLRLLLRSPGRISIVSMSFVFFVLEAGTFRIVFLVRRVAHKSSNR